MPLHLTCLENSQGFNWIGQLFPSISPTENEQLLKNITTPNQLPHFPRKITLDYMKYMKSILEHTYHMWWRRMLGSFRLSQLIPLAIALHNTKSWGAARGFCCIKVLLSCCTWILLAPTLPSLWFSPGVGSQSQQPTSLTGDTECPHRVLVPPAPSYWFPSHSKINGIEQTFPGVTRDLAGNISPACDFVQSLRTQIKPDSYINAKWP